MWLTDTTGFVAIEEKQFLPNIKDNNIVTNDKLIVKECLLQ